MVHSDHVFRPYGAGGFWGKGFLQTSRPYGTFALFDFPDIRRQASGIPASGIRRYPVIWHQQSLIRYPTFRNPVCDPESGC